MVEQRLIVAIGRVERALSRLEQLPGRTANGGGNDLSERHERLKSETKMAIADIDRILAGGS